MLKKNINIFGGFLSVLLFSLLLLAFYLLPNNPKEVQGAATVDDGVYKHGTSTQIFIGPTAAVNPNITSLSSGRTYLEISNISGATSTPQAIYCAVGVTPVKFSGIVIFASSTRIWLRDTIPLGSVKCVSQTSTTSITVIEK